MVLGWPSRTENSHSYPNHSPDTAETKKGSENAYWTAEVLTNIETRFEARAEEGL